MEAFTYDGFLKEIGGFGRYQLFVTITLVMAFMSGGEIVYGMQFLEKFPTYLCREIKDGPWIDCNRH